jgi:hypothetical protein
MREVRIAAVLPNSLKGVFAEECQPQWAVAH